nr:TetR/AcrR family transcriptional regulator [Tomitella cavernea]
MARTTETGPAAVDEAVRAVRVSSRRRQILDAAVRVMQRTGFHQMSMQALADEAQVSVGLIYKYFGGKEDVLLGTIVGILDAFQDMLEPAMAGAGDDPVERFAAGFRRYVEIVDENLDAVVLTYRESRTLTPAGRARIKELEISTAAPLRDALAGAIRAGAVGEVDVDLVTFDAMMLAHAWALKRWHFSPRWSLGDYCAAQLRLLLGGLIVPEHAPRYAHLLG